MLNPVKRLTRISDSGRKMDTAAYVGKTADFVSNMAWSTASMAAYTANTTEDPQIAVNAASKLKEMVQKINEAVTDTWLGIDPKWISVTKAALGAIRPIEFSSERDSVYNSDSNIESKLEILDNVLNGLLKDYYDLKTKNSPDKVFMATNSLCLLAQDLHNHVLMIEERAFPDDDR